jgi:predicted 2-oxoglutarate/Fe(II)-dependent dioxygenase YbiX|tara:strand:+ start:427 stop:954 length:528 start_codon:yes stop_codon:yes gene_type:complete
MLQILDYIKCYEDVIDNDFCEEIIKNDVGFNRATISDGIVSKERTCYDKFVDSKYEGDIFNIISKAVKKYSDDIPVFTTGLSREDTGYLHLLYKGTEKGEYVEHVDHMDIYPRVLTLSILLNDDFDGGDFSFFKREYKGPKKKGSVLIFPSNFCFPHAVTPVSNGDRHAIVTWIH